MPVYRIFAGPDGRSRIEPCAPGSLPTPRIPLPATQVYFREFAAGTFLDWHPAPRRQLVVIVSGRLENDVGDGEIHRFGPGDVRIIEDTTGRGHTTRVIGEEPALLAVVPLA